MTIYAREKIRDLMLAEWPPQDATEHAFVFSNIEYALKSGLLSIGEISAGLSYACGYEARDLTESIQRFYTVVGELTGYTNEAFVNRFFTNENEQTKAVKVKVMDNIGLWQ